MKLLTEYQKIKQIKGIEKDWPTKPNFLPFKEAREFVHSLKLKSRTKWQKYCKSGKKPDNIPACPDVSYKNSDWVSWGDWLGTGTIAPKDRQYLPFEEAREFARSLRITTTKEWQKYCKSGKKPDNIPACPDVSYKNSGWINYGDWLGTGTIAPKDRQYLPFKEAKEYVVSLGIKSQTEWFKYCKSDNKPDNIPTCPNHVYKDSGWVNWGDWLGTGRIAPKDRKFLPFKESRKFARSLNLKSGKKPDNIPTAPWRTYKDTGWISMGDWLGTGYIASQNREFLPFKEAREFVRSLKLKSKTEWVEYSKSGNKPDNIPVNPDRTYKNSGWGGYGDWLGTGYVANQNREYLPFEEARKFVRSLKIKGQKEWQEYCKSGKKPDSVPAYPNEVYKDTGWISMGDWLGTGTVASRNRKFLSFEEAREFAQSLNLKSRKEWEKYCKSGNKPNNIPACPWKIYKDTGWISVGDWLDK